MIKNISEIYIGIFRKKMIKNIFEIYIGIFRKISNYVAVANYVDLPPSMVSGKRISSADPIMECDPPNPSIFARSAIALDCASEKGCPFVVCCLFMTDFGQFCIWQKWWGQATAYWCFEKRIPFFVVFDQKWTSLKSISRASAPDWGSEKLFILAKNGPV